MSIIVHAYLMGVGSPAFCHELNMKRINCVLLSIALFIQLPVLVWLLRESVIQHTSDYRSRRVGSRGTESILVDMNPVIVEDPWNGEKLLVPNDSGNDIKGSDSWEHSEMFKVNLLDECLHLIIWLDTTHH